MITLEDDGRIVGLILPRSGLWRHAKSNPAMLVDGFAERDIVLARETGILSLVFLRLKRRGGGAAIVFRRKYRPSANPVPPHRHEGSTLQPYQTVSCWTAEMRRRGRRRTERLEQKSQTSH